MVFGPSRGPRNKPAPEIKHDLPTIPFGAVEIVRVLGRGAFGRVDQCIWSGADCAIKRLLNAEGEQDFVKEIEINKHLAPHQHQYVTRFLGLTANPPGILMELYPLRSVQDHVIKAGNFCADEDLPKILTILINASAGVLHLHAHCVIHRDIAARNFLIRQDLSAAVCDFGLSLLVSKPDEVKQRTPEERKKDLLPINSSAPEALVRGEYSAKSDVYMFGNFIWELLSRRAPHSDDRELMSGKIYPFIQRIGNGHHPAIPEDWPEQLQILLKSCWALQPQDRPSMTEVNNSLRTIRAIAEQTGITLQRTNHSDSAQFYESEQSMYLNNEPYETEYFRVDESSPALAIHGNGTIGIWKEPKIGSGKIPASAPSADPSPKPQSPTDQANGPSVYLSAPKLVSDDDDDDEGEGQQKYASSYLPSDPNFNLDKLMATTSPVVDQLSMSGSMSGIVGPEPCCEVCEDKHPATARCLECSESMCKMVAVVHSRQKATRSHKIQPVK